MDHIVWRSNRSSAPDAVNIRTATPDSDDPSSILWFKTYHLVEIITHFVVVCHDRAPQSLQFYSGSQNVNHVIQLKPFQGIPSILTCSTPIPLTHYSALKIECCGSTHNITIKARVERVDYHHDIVVKTGAFAGPNREYEFRVRDGLVGINYTP